MAQKNHIRNIGILAHVDAGKTTLTEALLYQSGCSRFLGSVDAGTSHTDTLEVERARGISVKASQIDLSYKNHTIYLIDTPGHIDFMGEVERSIGILDGAILVISAVEGIQPQTKLYFEVLQKLHIPTLIFINKIDRIGANSEKVLESIRTELSPHVLPTPLDLSDEDSIALLSTNDESLLESYYENKLTTSLLDGALTVQSQKALVYPVFCGTALKGEGILPLLEGIIHYLPAPLDLDHKPVSGIIYKVSHHKTLGKLSHVRLFSGQLTCRDEILNVTSGALEKITIIKKIIGQKEVDVKEATSGELVLLGGLNGHIGDILGSDTFIPPSTTLANPLLTIKVYTEKEEDYLPLISALTLLEEEDPLLALEWIKEKREINIQIMGLIQQEILHSILKERFNLNVSFSTPSVIYKETPSSAGYGIEHYTMPKPCWAIVEFSITPLPLGSGVIYESKVRTEDIKLKYQREIQDNLMHILKQGLYGWQVTDLKIVLENGSDHVMHSRPGDFATATAMGLMKGFNEIGMTLLEPLIAFHISVPEDLGGRVLNDIIQMRGTFDSPTIENGLFYVSGILPVATSLTYSVTLGILTSGRGTLSTQFHGYQPCPFDRGTTRERIGVNPLDRSKYILYVRNAL